MSPLVEDARTDGLVGRREQARAEGEALGRVERDAVGKVGEGERPEELSRVGLCDGLGKLVACSRGSRGRKDGRKRSQLAALNRPPGRASERTKNDGPSKTSRATRFPSSTISRQTMLPPLGTGPLEPELSVAALALTSRRRK